MILAQVAQRGDDLPSLETFSVRLDKVLRNLILLKVFLRIARGLG